MSEKRAHATSHLSYSQNDRSSDTRDIGRRNISAEGNASRGAITAVRKVSSRQVSKAEEASLTQEESLYSQSKGRAVSLENKGVVRRWQSTSAVVVIGELHKASGESENQAARQRWIPYRSKSVTFEAQRGVSWNCPAVDHLVNPRGCSPRPNQGRSRSLEVSTLPVPASRVNRSVTPRFPASISCAFSPSQALSPVSTPAPPGPGWPPSTEARTTVLSPTVPAPRPYRSVTPPRSLTPPSLVYSPLGLQCHQMNSCAVAVAPALVPDSSLASGRTSNRARSGSPEVKIWPLASALSSRVSSRFRRTMAPGAVVPALVLPANTGLMTRTGQSRSRSAEPRTVSPNSASTSRASRFHQVHHTVNVSS
eukprot:gnl/MRDRNA2_/MRDRNA2_75995_c0_seq1.p1 gnl/MRDRNA2_/MRDRNA2_75995_c0~~gnl/MRDRNA2_/MRDRNA2_75995_c0_seq1.p1  ORF type:complete len:425 (+),score=38.99 gnl/MRDRNA2_/MRDRNA2_75995_c0_seq1:178-1275(+)